MPNHSIAIVPSAVPLEGGTVRTIGTPIVPNDCRTIGTIGTITALPVASPKGDRRLGVNPRRHHRSARRLRNHSSEPSWVGASPQPNGPSSRECARRVMAGKRSQTLDEAEYFCSVVEELTDALRANYRNAARVTN